MPDVVTIENSGIVTVIHAVETVTVIYDSTGATIVDDASIVTILENSEIVTVIDGTSTVTTVSVVSANGFAGSVANETTAPEITISTTVSGIIKGDGTAISAATAGTDYVIPSGNITGTAAGLSATLAVASGGTGVITSTGSGAGVHATSPTLVTPILGAATATSVNKLTLTQPATGATLTIANGATLTASATASVSGTNTGDNAVNSLYSSLVSDKTVVLTNGTGISITGTYPNFTINSSITQYADTDARKSLSAGTGISYDDTTGIITNDDPDQTVSLTGGTDISVSGTYPDFTIDFDGSTSYLPLAGGTLTGNIVFDGTSGQYIGKGTFDTARSGNYGISIVCSVGYEFNWQAGWLVTTEQASATPRPLYLDSLAGTTLRAWDSSKSTGTEVDHLGITFADSTVQTTAYTGGGANVLDDLTDVTISSVADGEFLSYSSAVNQWINSDRFDGGNF